LSAVQPWRWQRELAEAVTDPRELLAILGLPESLAEPAERAGKAFSLRVARSFISRMSRGDPNDPLLRQVLPVGDELAEIAGYSADPLEEGAARRAPQLLHKYTGRALLIATEACAIHCRYCFRREFPYSEQQGDSTRFHEALDEIARDPSLEEIILSGGDPLSLGDSRLTSLTDQLAKIPHIRRLRLHTRQPVVLPSRVDDGLVHWLQRLPWPVVFVLHSTHANEIDDSVRDACARLKKAGVTLLNQTVLLKGINDHVQTLADLSRALFDAGVLPYYLHVLDRVTGAAHFDLPEQRAREIAGELASCMPGYLVPRLVREVEGAPAKLTLEPRFGAAPVSN
jgi:EF-P beta-lysylation protein EpmB